MPDRPNLLLVSLDTLRCDALGCCGNPLARTPNIDALAKGGTRFARAYCSHPHCMPSRASVMTGRHCAAHGVWQNGVPLNEREITLPAVLAEAGYATALYGKAHFRHWRRDFQSPDECTEHAGEGPYYGFAHARVVDHSEGDAFSQWVRREHPDLAELAIHPYRERPDEKTVAWKSTLLPPEATKTHFIAEATIEAIRSRDGDRPFFIWSSFLDPHHPLAPPKCHGDLYDDADFPPPPALVGPWPDLPAHYAQWRGMVGSSARAAEQWLTIRRMYQGKVSHVDAELGRILAELEAAGLAETTVVVLLADHGTMLGDYGLMAVGPYSQEAVVRIPMIWRGPGVAGGGVCEELASVVDVMPTLLDLAGVEVPLGVQGLSLRPLLGEGSGARTFRDYLIIEQRMEQQPPAGFKTLVTRRHKLSLYNDPGEGELYDLESDPRELRNLYGRQEAAAVREELTQSFARALLFDDDPLPLRRAPW